MPQRFPSSWNKLGVVNFHRGVGQNFAYVRTDGQTTTDRILTFALHRFNGGAVFYQRWSRGFNPRMPLGVIWPTWITFPDLPLEFHKVARRVAEQVGQVLAETHEGSFDSPPRFCVGVDIRKGWVSNVIGFSAAGGSASIAVQYEAMELNCHHCGHHQHPTRACQNQPSGILPRAPDPGPMHHYPGVSMSPPRGAYPRTTVSPGSHGPPTRQRGYPGHQGSPPQQRRRRPRRAGPGFCHNPYLPVEPDPNGFIPVQRQRRRPTFFDIRPTHTHHNPSTDTPPRQVSAPSSPQSSPTPTTSQAPAVQIPASTTPSPSRERHRPSGWDVTSQISSPNFSPVESPVLGQQVAQQVPSSPSQSSRAVAATPNHSPEKPDDIMDKPSIPYYDPNDSHNDTSRSGNHYSNGESRLTPLYKWNGWEKVYRTKKPYRYRPRNPHPLSLPSTDESALVDDASTTAMDVDSEGKMQSEGTDNPTSVDSQDSQPSRTS